MKLIIMQFSLTYHFIPLRSKYSPQQFFLKYPQNVYIYSPWCQRPSFTDPYKTKSKTIVLYILIFTILDTRRDDKMLTRETISILTELAKDIQWLTYRRGLSKVYKDNVF
jgi:hypothetical protein